jgi:hypothetical protein
MQVYDFMYVAVENSTITSTENMECWSNCIMKQIIK